mmetsp:Transcript_9845/g.22014  ORF Transcript_9845/g.22014 Transcript_9845/m.22014 type:complete len:253 (-) Transcript_9845:912-1670(-)
MPRSNIFLEDTRPVLAFLTSFSAFRPPLVLGSEPLRTRLFTLLRFNFLVLSFLASLAFLALAFARSFSFLAFDFAFSLAFMAAFFALAFAFAFAFTPIAAILAGGIHEALLSAVLALLLAFALLALSILAAFARLRSLLSFVSFSATLCVLLPHGELLSMKVYLSTRCKCSSTALCRCKFDKSKAFGFTSPLSGYAYLLHFTIGAKEFLQVRLRHVLVYATDKNAMSFATRASCRAVLRARLSLRCRGITLG